VLEVEEDDHSGGGGGGNFFLDSTKPCKVDVPFRNCQSFGFYQREEKG
jgi:hypothetical protein